MIYAVLVAYDLAAANVGVVAAADFDVIATAVSVLGLNTVLCCC